LQTCRFHLPVLNNTSTYVLFNPWNSLLASQGDVILVGLRDYQDEKADVILKCAACP
jgi:hypothetical protein